MNGIENVGIQNIGKIDDPSPVNKITYQPPLISLEKAMRNTSSGQILHSTGVWEPQYTPRRSNRWGKQARSGEDFTEQTSRMKHKIFKQH